MARNVFYSFHYAADAWRAAQVRNMGVVDGNVPARDNDWETVKKEGDAAVERWISGQMFGRTCMVLLIGNQTAGRRWINYEIETAWQKGLGLAGIFIHGLQDQAQQTSSKGIDPFARYAVNAGTTPLSNYVATYDPTASNSSATYANIKAQLPGLVDRAITLRNNFKPTLGS